MHFREFTADLEPLVSRLPPSWSRLRYALQGHFFLCSGQEYPLKPLDPALPEFETTWIKSTASKQAPHLLMLLLPMTLTSSPGSSSQSCSARVGLCSQPCGQIKNWKTSHADSEVAKKGDITRLKTNIELHSKFLDANFSTQNQASSWSRWCGS